MASRPTQAARRAAYDPSMAFIPLGEWIDRHAGENLFDAPGPVALPTIVLARHRRRTVDPVHARLRVQARRRLAAGAGKG
jgi:hypothetical protein